VEPNEVKEDLKKFFEMLNYTEESDSGRIFNPVNISCVRVHMVQPLNEILKRLEDYANE